MPQEDNIIEFPTAEQAEVETLAKEAPAEVVAPFTYHYSAFRVTKQGETVWFDGIAGLDAPILTQQHYGSFKKLIAEHYDVPESNLVVVSLVRQNTLNFEVPPVPEKEEAAG